jgi:hypothetical protein
VVGRLASTGLHVAKALGVHKGITTEI